MRGGDGGDFAGHRFKERHAEAIVDRGQHEDVAALIEVVDVCYVAHDFEIGDARHALCERGIMRKASVRTDEQPRVGEGEALPCFEQIKVALAHGIAADDAYDEFSVTLRTRLCREGIAAEERRLD